MTALMVGVLSRCTLTDSISLFTPHAVLSVEPRQFLQKWHDGNIVVSVLHLFVLNPCWLRLKCPSYNAQENCYILPYLRRSCQSMWVWDLTRLIPHSLDYSTFQSPHYEHHSKKKLWLLGEGAIFERKFQLDLRNPLIVNFYYVDVLIYRLQGDVL